MGRLDTSDGRKNRKTTMMANDEARDLGIPARDTAVLAKSGKRE